MRAVARMIDIAMGQDDEAQFTGPATCCRKLSVKLVPPSGKPRVDEDVTALDIDEIAVHAQVDPADSADHAVLPVDVGVTTHRLLKRLSASPD